MFARAEARGRLARFLFRLAGTLATLVAHAAAGAVVQTSGHARAHRGHAVPDASARWIHGHRAARIWRLPARVGRKALVSQQLVAMTRAGQSGVLDYCPR